MVALAEGPNYNSSLLTLWTHGRKVDACRGDESKPMGVCSMMLAGWMNRHQQDVVVYLKDENKIPREKLGTGILRIRVSLGHGRSISSTSSQ